MIIITGASRGLGKELIKYYNNLGVEVIGTYNTTPPSDLPERLYRKVDICKFNDVVNFASSLKSDSRQQLTLINCAGVNYNSLLHKSDAGAWAQVIQTNLIGTYNVIRALMPMMRETASARIINISSVVPQVGMAGTTAYAASKAGLWGLTKSLSKEFKGKDITINTINLGYFETGMIEQVPPQIQETIKEKIPAGRFGEVKEFVSLIEYIRSASYTNGSCFDMNGGFF